MNRVTEMMSKEIAGLRFQFLEMGEGRPVILLHGRAPDLRFVSPLADRLSRRYRVVAPVRPCQDVFHGESRVARQTMNLLAELGFGPTDDGVVKASLVGWGDGGLLALYIARHYPGRVEKIAAINPTFQLADDADREAGTILYTTPDSAPMSGADALHGFPFDDPSVWPDIARRMRDGGMVITLDGAAKTLQFDRIRAPVLVVAGDRDLVAAERVLALAATVPNGRLDVLSDCGPFALLEKPEEVAKTLMGFLDVPLPDLMSWQLAS